MCSIHTKYDYHANTAQRKYEELLSSSRSGVNLTQKELRHLDRIVRPLVEQGQSPYMILTNHPELGISVKTLYNYIEQNLLLTRNIHPKRKVKFKKRKSHNTQISDPGIFIGRTYKDFKDSHADELDFWEMDTVLSVKGSTKCILTFYFPPIELLWAHVMDRCSPGAVKSVFQHLQTALGDATNSPSFSL